MKSHQTAGKISWSLLHDLMLLERDLPGWLGDCEFFSPDWWINEGSTDTDYMDWYWLISPEMSKLLDQLMIIHIYDDTIWWRIGGSSSETKKYTRWINMLSDSLLHRVLRVFLLKCLVQPIWEMFIYIYIYLKLETTKQTTVILGHQTLRFYLSSQYLARKTIDWVICFTGILQFYPSNRAWSGYAWNYAMTLGYAPFSDTP